MNSKIFKKPFISVEITDRNVSGKMLSMKLESWCEAEPSILLWETGYEEAPVRAYANIEGKEFETSGSNWTITFHIIRANAIVKDGLFDGVAILAGTIRNSLEVTDERSQEAYLLSLHSRSLKGEKTFISAIDLWKTLTSLGIKRS